MATDQLIDNKTGLALEIVRLRKLLSDIGGQVELHAGHLGDPNFSCECRYIFDDGHAGGIAIGEVHVSNGLPISEGGNDAPDKELAAAYLRLIVGAVNALPDLLDKVEGK